MPPKKWGRSRVPLAYGLSFLVAASPTGAHLGGLARRGPLADLHQDTGWGLSYWRSQQNDTYQQRNSGLSHGYRGLSGILTRRGQPSLALRLAGWPWEPLPGNPLLGAFPKGLSVTSELAASPRLGRCGTVRWEPLAVPATSRLGALLFGSPLGHSEPVGKRGDRAEAPN
jgi:hypothetical protein